VGSIAEGVKTVNAAARTALLAMLVAVLAAGAFFGYNEYTKRERILQDKDQQIEFAQQQLVSMQNELDGKQAEIRQLNIHLEEQALQIEKLETALHLLKVDQRLALLKVLKIERDEEGNALQSTLEFLELSPTGEALSEPKRMELPGDVVYIDNWVIKFDDAFIERGDIERGTSLCLFRRIFSEQQTPSQGVSLDEIGMRPQAYARGGVVTAFEQSLWADFWEFANDPTKAASMGIRAANGEAVSIKVREGKAYHVSLRASGGLSIEPAAKLEE
jgi:hypothetical protein